MTPSILAISIIGVLLVIAGTAWKRSLAEVARLTKALVDTEGMLHTANAKLAAEDRFWSLPGRKHVEESEHDPVRIRSYAAIYVGGLRVYSSAAPTRHAAMLEAMRKMEAQ